MRFLDRRTFADLAGLRENAVVLRAAEVLFALDTAIVFAYENEIRGLKWRLHWNKP